MTSDQTHSENLLSVSDFAQIESAKIEFGDLTVLVGPQASGKSLLLQLLKLAIDGPSIFKTMNQFALVVRDRNALLARYFGEGMEKAWSDKTKVEWEGTPLNLNSLLQARGNARKPGTVYFAPAHRTLTLADGYPPTFQQFRAETPFVVRQFSEALRQVLITGQDRGEQLFPQKKRLKGRVKQKIDDAIFHGARLREDTSGIQRQLRLEFNADSGDTSLSYMTWTAGQREFIPLLLGLYYLLPAGQSRKRSGTRWVVIEEPEMGLHPQGTMSLMLLVLDLLARGYRVALATHSPLVLDVVWAMQTLKARHANPRDVLELFGITGATKANARGEVEMAERALEKDYRVHLLKFNANRRVESRDISSLDPGSSDPDIAGWGGLTGISGQIGSVVSRLSVAPVKAKRRGRG